MNLLLAINRERHTTCIMVRIAFHFARAAYGLLFGRSAVICSFTFNSAIALQCNCPSPPLTHNAQVTHNPDLECYADRVLYLQDGRIVKSEPLCTWQSCCPLTPPSLLPPKPFSSQMRRE